MNWYERSEITESCADRREFLDGAYNLFGGSHTFSAAGPILSMAAGYVLGRTLFGRRS